jgi:hypothetical protein
MAAPVGTSRAAKAARRLAPLALEAWRRWERLPEEEKERIRERVRAYVSRGRSTVERARARRATRRGGPPAHGQSQPSGYPPPPGRGAPPAGQDPPPRP